MQASIVSSSTHLQDQNSKLPKQRSGTALASLARPVTIRGRIWEVLNDPQSSAKVNFLSVWLPCSHRGRNVSRRCCAQARWYGIFMTFIIALSTVSFILETEESLIVAWADEFMGIEVSRRRLLLQCINIIYSICVRVGATCRQGTSVTIK